MPSRLPSRLPSRSGGSGGTHVIFGGEESRTWYTEFVSPLSHYRFLGALRPLGMTRQVRITDSMGLESPGNDPTRSAAPVIWDQSPRVPSRAAGGGPHATIDACPRATPFTTAVQFPIRLFSLGANMRRRICSTYCGKGKALPYPARAASGRLRCSCT